MVNAANTALVGGGGINGALHKDPDYAKAHRGIKALYPKSGFISGHAVMVSSGGHKAKGFQNVIVVAGPSIRDRPAKEKGLPISDEEKGQLYSCYYNSLVLAASQNVESIAFPSISTGLFLFPPEEAAKVATKAIADYMIDHAETSIRSISIHFMDNQKDDTSINPYMKAVPLRVDQPEPESSESSKSPVTSDDSLGTTRPISSRDSGLSISEKFDWE